MKRLHHCLLPPHPTPRTPISTEISFFSSSTPLPLSHLISISKMTSVGAMRALKERNKAGEQEVFTGREAEAEGGGKGRRISGRKKIKTKMTGKDRGRGVGLMTWAPIVPIWSSELIQGRERATAEGSESGAALAARSSTCLFMRGKS